MLELAANIIVWVTVFFVCFLVGIAAGCLCAAFARPAPTWTSQRGVTLPVGATHFVVIRAYAPNPDSIALCVHNRAEDTTEAILISEATLRALPEAIDAFLKVTTTT